MLEHKQNVFDDFIAAAEHLIAEGYATSSHLAIQGGSNGGLLVGAVSNQRPDSVRGRGLHLSVARHGPVPPVPGRQLLGARVRVERGSRSSSPIIHAYSPYHNVVEGGEYPATLYLSGDGDTRVAPLHARKMAALMQANNGSEHPILLRYHTQAGHSGVVSRSASRSTRWSTSSAFCSGRSEARHDAADRLVPAARHCRGGRLWSRRRTGRTSAARRRRLLPAIEADSLLEATVRTSPPTRSKAGRRVRPARPRRSTS